MTAVETRSVRVAPSRELGVWVGDGDPKRSVVVMHGMPGSGLLYPGWLEDAAARGIRLISYDRPGYGSSSACPGRSVADCAAEVRAITDELGVERVAVWGWSGEVRTRWRVRRCSRTLSWLRPCLAHWRPGTRPG